MIKRFLFSLCAVCALSLNSFAQNLPFNVPSLSIKIKGDRTVVQPGEYAILTAKGNNDEIYSLQWQVSTDGIKWKDIPKATGTYFETASLTETQFFRIIGRANEGYLAIDDISNIQAITMGDNVASAKKQKQ